MKSLKKQVKQVVEEDEILILNDCKSIFIRILITIPFYFLIAIFIVLLVFPVYLITSLVMDIESLFEGRTNKNKIKQALDKHALLVEEKYPKGLNFDSTNIPVGDIPVEDFLRLRFFNFNEEYYTNDPVTFRITCDTQRRRSLGDIYLICKFYYPECTIHEVVQTLINMLIENRLRASYCSTIHKYVFHTDPNGTWIKNGKVEYEGIDNFGQILNCYK